MGNFHPPLTTLRPYYWEPTYASGLSRPDRVGGPINTEVLGPALGVRTTGADLVGRHRYGVEARVRTDGRADATVNYTYSGLGNPLLDLSASQSHYVDGPLEVVSPAGDDATLYVAEKERAVRASSTLLRRRIRNRTSLSFAVAHIWEDREHLDTNLEPSVISILRPRRRLGEAQVGARFSTARAFPFSTSDEAGVLVAVRGRARRELSLSDTLRGSTGFDRSWNEVTGSFQAYQSVSGPGFSNHVLAARSSFGVAGGPVADAFHFSVGGAHGRPESLTGAELFGGSRLPFPVRGYFEGRRTGRYAWSVSGEYRFPLLNIHQGISLLPVHVDRVSGALFVDAGNAWGGVGPVDGSPPDPRPNAVASVGAELQTSVTALFSTRMFFRLGAALRLNSGTGSPFYLRLGTAF